MADALKNGHSLAWMFLNVVRWDTNEQWRKALCDLVSDDVRESRTVDRPADYLWSGFEGFLANRLEYNSASHMVVFAQFGLREPRVAELHDMHVWEWTLHGIAVNQHQLAPGNTDLFFLTVPRKNPKQLVPSLTLKILHPGLFDKTQSPLSPISQESSVPWIVEPSVEDVVPMSATPGVRPVQDDAFLRVPPLDLEAAPMGSPIRTEIEVEELLDDYSGDEDSVHKATQAVRIVYGDGEGYCENIESPMASIFGLFHAHRSSDQSPPDTPSDYSEDDQDGSSPSTPSQDTPATSTGRSASSLSSGPSTPTKTPRYLFANTSTRGRSTTRGAPASRGRGSTASSSVPRSVASTTTKPNVGLSRSNAIRRPSPVSLTSSNAIRRKSPLAATRASSSLPASPTVSETAAEPYLEIVDMVATEYNVANAEDDDYGAVDDNVVDTYIGSYNTGDDETKWHACLDFFKLNPAEYEKREALAAKAGADRKRVPMKKLPGMSVGLFDYQLIGMFNLLEFILNDVSGGLLSDEQGLGKTHIMYGLIAFAHNLRKCKVEVKAAWKKPGGGKVKGTNTQHNSRSSTLATSCPFDDRYGFRCYCYHAPTRDLADRLPEGPNIIIVPARGCAALVRDAKAKLDSKNSFKIRACHDGADKENKLTAAEIKALCATITATDNADGPAYHYEAGAGQSDFIIVVSPEWVDRLNGQFGIAVRGASSGLSTQKSALLPGLVLMDEFHEYAASDSSRTVAWLQHLKKACLESEQPAALTYFVSGTCLGETPADLRPALSVLEKETRKDESHPLQGATIASFDNLTATFDTLVGLQASGEAVARSDIADYRRGLDRILKRTMVRRLGIDRFRGRPLTDIGPLKVNIIDHLLPEAAQANLQALANHTRELAVAAAANEGVPLTRLLRSKTGEDLFLKLRLASTFPGIAGPSGADFTFALSELRTHLAAAGNDVTKTPYYRHVPVWAAHSAKLETISQTVAAMLADRSPIPGGPPSPAKKYCIFTPTEAEAVLIQAYLLIKRGSTTTTPTPSTPKKTTTTSSLKNLKPVLLNSNLTQSARTKVIDTFLAAQGNSNAAPNVLVAPIALAGTGLNLQAARYATVTGPAWTRRANQQAYYRIHRVGQRMETKLGLLVGRWNPAERSILAGYEGRQVGAGAEGDEEGGVWEVDNKFCLKGGEGETEGGLVERHQGSVRGE